MNGCTDWAFVTISILSDQRAVNISSIQVKALDFKNKRHSGRDDSNYGHVSFRSDRLKSDECINQQSFSCMSEVSSIWFCVYRATFPILISFTRGNYIEGLEVKLMKLLFVLDYIQIHIDDYVSPYPVVYIVRKQGSRYRRRKENARVTLFLIGKDGRSCYSHSTETIQVHARCRYQCKRARNWIRMQD